MVENKSTVEKPKKPRSQAQIDAFEKARQKRQENLANKKKEKEKNKLTKEEKQEIKDYNKGFNVKTDKAPKVQEEDTATNVVVQKADYDPFKEANKKNGVGQPKKKDLEVTYIDPPKPKRQYNKKPKPAPVQEEVDDELEDFTEWLDAPDTDEEEVKPVVIKKPKKAPPKKKKPPKVIYETDSSDEEEQVIVKRKPKSTPVAKKPDYTSNLSLKDRLRLNGF